MATRAQLGTQNLSSSDLNTVQSLTLPTGAQAVRLYVVQVGTGDLLITHDGTTPTTTNGGVLSQGVYEFEGALDKVRLINGSSGGYRVYAVYYTDL